MSSLCALFVLPIFAASFSLAGEPLPGTQPFTAEGDLSVQMVEGIDRWLMRETERVSKARHLDVSTPEALTTARALLRQRLGMVDALHTGQLERMETVGPSERFDVRTVRWPVFDDVMGQGLLYEPNLLYEPKGAVAFVVLLDDESDENARPPRRDRDFPSLLAEHGCLVLVPKMVGLGKEMSGSVFLGRKTEQTHREWIYRQAFEVGRTLIGYEAQSVLASLDHFARDQKQVGIIGYGEGALVAKYVAALEPRFQSVLLSGHFGPRESLWREPIYRNVFGLLRDFGDAELAAMSAAKAYVIEACDAPKLAPSGRAAAPHSESTPTVEAVRAEAARAGTLRKKPPVVIVPEPPGFWTNKAVEAFLLGLGVKLDANIPESILLWNPHGMCPSEPRFVRELEAHTQRILRESERVRKALPIWAKLKPGAEWDAVQKQARADFWEKVIGKLPTDYLPPNPRTRLIHDKEKWRGYEVMLDVQPDIFAWGTLLVPKDLKPGERRPVVVCQHGLEGLPEDTITQDESAPAWKYYKGFAARLCERGFIVYAPHNPYRGGDNFRRIQREANPLGLSLFSFIIAQHDVTTQWLASLPFVDAERIAFYGLSYGGKTAMRVPSVLERYCLSICSGDFNEWVMKCASNTHPGGYIFTGEWEIWEWDLAHTFNYAEMALLIAPRPFMVERGHDDGVGLDEDVGHEFAKVRRGYDKLGIGERTEIEWFDGPHTIHGVGTFKFLHKWLRWPEPK